MITDEFDKASWEVDKENFTEDTNCENCIEWIRNSKTATLSFSQKRYVTKIKRLAEKYPDEIQIVYENNDGSIIAHIPVSAIHISIRKRKELTEEQREAAVKRLMLARQKRFGNRELTEDEIKEIEDEVDNDDIDEDE